MRTSPIMCDHSNMEFINLVSVVDSSAMHLDRIKSKIGSLNDSDNDVFRIAFQQLPREKES